MRQIEVIASFYLEATGRGTGVDEVQAMLEKATEQGIISVRVGWELVESYDHGEA